MLYNENYSNIFHTPPMTDSWDKSFTEKYGECSSLTTNPSMADPSWRGASAYGFICITMIQSLDGRKPSASPRSNPSMAESILHYHDPILRWQKAFCIATIQFIHSRTICTPFLKATHNSNGYKWKYQQVERQKGLWTTTKLLEL